jgi:hypothetical protein
MPFCNGQWQAATISSAERQKDGDACLDAAELLLRLPSPLVYPAYAPGKGNKHFALQRLMLTRLTLPDNTNIDDRSRGKGL